MFQTVPLPIIRSFSLHTQQWYMSYRFADSLREGSGRNCSVLILLASSWFYYKNSLSLCNSEMFRPSKSHLQGARLIHVHGQINEICTRREIQFIVQLILYYAAAICWSNAVLIKWCESYKYAWFDFIWSSDISARKRTRYSLMFRLFSSRKLIRHYYQWLFCVPCRKRTCRTLNWKMDTCCQSDRMFISENTRTYSMNVTLPIPLW